ncbi:MAG TPA: helix-turn-helix domain-containing protein [Streptomyces sp.]|nr:helix-turn-helix domain-containing protein [Streptomyces sp.]
MSKGFVSRLLIRRDTTTAAIRDAMVALVPGYARLPSVRHRVLLHEVDETWTPVLRRAAANEPLGESDLDVYRDLGLRRARASFSFDDLKAGFEVAHTAGLRDCLAAIEAGDREEPMAFTAWGVREQRRVLQAVTDAYLGARCEAGEQWQARELLVERLLDGQNADVTAAALHMDLPEGYLVLVCRPRGREDLAAGALRAAAGHALAGVPGALWRENPAAGRLVVLLPVNGDLARVRAAAVDVTADLARTLGERLHVSEAHGPTLDDVPAAFGEADRAVVLVAAMPDAGGRPYRADELLIELAVARQPDIRQRLAGLLAPLRQGTDLRRTLEVLFDCGLDREQTTRALYIHRRTLTYRIQRIRDLTGLDPTTAHGIQLLRGALTASRLDGILPEAAPGRHSPVHRGQPV